jgi:hypothetical protein
MKYSNKGKMQPVRIVNPNVARIAGFSWSLIFALGAGAETDSATASASSLIPFITTLPKDVGYLRLAH